MVTRCIIQFDTYNRDDAPIVGSEAGSTPRRIFVSYDGYPTWTGNELVSIIRRDGVELAAEILSMWTGWGLIASSEHYGDLECDFTFYRRGGLPGYGGYYDWRPGYEYEEDQNLEEKYVEWFYRVDTTGMISVYAKRWENGDSTYHGGEFGNPHRFELIASVDPFSSTAFRNLFVAEQNETRRNYPDCSAVQEQADGNTAMGTANAAAEIEAEFDELTDDEIACIQLGAVRRLVREQFDNMECIADTAERVLELIAKHSVEASRMLTTIHRGVPLLDVMA